MAPARSRRLRRRAGLSEEALYTLDNYREAGYSSVLDVVLDERRLELCFEGQRWYDLVRFGKLEEGVKKLAKYSSVATSQAQNFQPKHVIFPIPQDVIDASNGKIEQNPLWK